MSKEIDEKVVSMKFDNSNFEKNVQTSMSTLDKFKAKISDNLTGNSFEGLNNTIRKLDFNPLTRAADTVVGRFSAMEVAGVTALANITNSAVNAGKRIVSALTVDPIKTGFSEYELKMGSIQTIMAGTGESLDTVNKYLNELNEYSDKTIYSFSDMTSNIGKFTNAGVKLEDAVMAIKGISNEAAVSGANANEASRAMYNFSQALSAGFVKLIDWKSIENANMATKEFKQMLIDSAVEAKTLKKASNGMYTTSKGNQLNSVKNFNDTLQDQWMTTEVLIKTLRKYSDETTDIGQKAIAAAQDVKTASQLYDTLKESAQSGWAETWETIFGDFNQGKELWTKMSKVFGGLIDKTSKARNAILHGAFGDQTDKWKELTDKISKAGIKTEDFEKALIKTAKKAGVPIDDLVKKYGSLEASIKSGWLTKGIVADTLKSLVGGGKEFTGTVSGMSKGLTDFRKIVNDVIRGDYKNGHARVEALTKAGYNYSEVQALVNKQLRYGKIDIQEFSKVTGIQTSELEKLAKEAESSGSSLEELITSMSRKSGRELFLESFANIGETIKAVVESIKKAWGDIFKPITSNDLYGVIEKFNDLSKSITKLSKNDRFLKDIVKTFRGLFAALDLIKTVATGGLGFAFTVLQNVLSRFGLTVLDATAYLGELIYKFDRWLKGDNFIVNFLVSVIEKIFDLSNSFRGVSKNVGSFNSEVHGLLEQKGVINTLHTQFKKFKDFVIDIFSKIKDVIVSIKKEIGSKFTSEYLSGGLVVISDFIDRMKELDGFTLENLIIGFKDFYDNVIGYFFDFSSIIDNVSSKLNNFSFKSQGSVSNLADSFKKSNKEGSGLFDTIMSILSGEKSLDELMAENSKAQGGSFFKGGAFDENLKIGNIISLATTGGLLYSIGNITTALTNLSEPLGGLGKVTDAAAKTIKSFTRVAKAMAMNIRSQALINIAIAIGILAASLIGLAFAARLLDTDAKIKGFSVLAGFLVGLVLSLSILAYAISKIKKLDVVGLAGVLVAFGVSVMLLAGAMYILSKIDFRDYTLGMSLIALVGIIGMLTVAAYTLGSQAPIFAVGAELLLAFAASVVILAIALTKISKIGDNLWPAVGALLIIMAVFTGLSLAMSSLEALPGIDIKAAALSMIGMAFTLLSIAKALVMVAKIPEEKLTLSLKVVGGIVGVLVGIYTYIAWLTSRKNKEFGGAERIALSIASLGACLLLIAVALKIIASINNDQKQLYDAVGAVGIIIFIMMFLMDHIANVQKDVKGLSATLISIGGLLMIMAAVMSVLAALSEDQLKKAIICVGVMSAFVAGLVWVTRWAGDYKNTATTINAMSNMLVKMALCIAILAMLDETRVAIAGGILGGMMIAFSIMLALTKKFKAFDKKQVGSIIFITAIVAALTGIVVALSLVDVTPALKSAGAIAILLVSMAAAMYLIDNCTNKVDLKTIGTLMGIVAVLGALAFVVTKMSSADAGSFKTVAAVLGILVGSLVIFGVAAKVLETSLPAIMSLSVVILALSGAMLLAGISSQLFADAFVKFSQNAATGAAGIVMVITSLLTTIPLFFTALGNGIVGFAGVILDGAPVIGQAIVAVFASICQAIAASSSEISTALLTIITVVCTTISRASTTIGLTVATLILSMLTILAIYVPKIAEAGMKLILGLLEGIKKYLPKIVSVGIDIVVELINGIADGIPKIVDAAFNLVVKFIDGISNGITKHQDEMTKAAIKLVKSLVLGIKNSLSQVKDAAMELGSTVLSTIKEKLGIASPSKEAAILGKFTDMGLAKGLMKNTSLVRDAANNVGDNLKSALQNSISKIADSVSSDIDSQPVITPVLDLSNIESGAGRLSGLLNMSPTTAISSTGLINKMMGGNKSTSNSDIVSAIADLGNKFMGTGDIYNINGITYDDGSNVMGAIEQLVHYAKIEGRT